MKSLEEFKKDIDSYKVRGFGYEVSAAPDNCLAVRWNVAGARGGSCWGHVAEDIDPEEEPIEEFEEKVISVYKYLLGVDFDSDTDRNLYTSKAYDLCTEKDETEYEYYGNWLHYNYRYVEAEPLYNLIYSLSRAARIDDILEDLENKGL